MIDMVTASNRNEPVITGLSLVYILQITHYSVGLVWQTMNGKLNEKKTTNIIFLTLQRITNSPLK